VEELAQLGGELVTRQIEDAIQTLDDAAAYPAREMVQAHHASVAYPMLETKLTLEQTTTMLLRVHFRSDLSSA
jgi:hypothetical protein